MKTDNVLRLAGLAARAGQCVSGEFSSEEEIRKGNAFLCLLAEDASPGTKKKFRNRCSYYNVTLREAYTKEELGHALGKELRSVLVILEKGFADSIRKQLDLR